MREGNALLGWQDEAHDGSMEWSSDVAAGVGSALLEALVCGVGCDLDAVRCRVLLEVLALPETGPIDPDPRRVLVLAGVTSVEVLLRPEAGPVPGGLGPAVPLRNLGEVERVFASLAWSHPMYSWKFIDDEENPKDRWPDEPSLRLVLKTRPGNHSLYWFTECGMQQGPDKYASYLLEGVIRFTAASVEHADGHPQPLAQFVADSARWWRAFSADDPRLSVDAQRAAGASALSWRPEREQRDTVFVPGDG